MLRFSFLFLMLIALTPALAGAGEIYERYGFGAEIGLTKLVGGENDYSNLDQSFALHLRKGLSSRWSLGMGFAYATNRPGVDMVGDDAGWTFDSGSGFHTVTTFYHLDARYRLLEDRSLVPWIGLSAGFLDWKVYDLRGEGDVGFFPSGDIARGTDTDGVNKDLEDSGLSASLALGAEFFVSQNLAFDFGCRYTLMPGGGVDNVGLSTLWGGAGADDNSGAVGAFVGMTWYFGAVDSDKDGIRNRWDTCPDTAEDFDGFEDEDGCPDYDNDSDGIADARDACPNEPEDRDGFEDEDGCPEVDNDGDGIFDAADACADAAEDFDGFEDEDGCPDVDNDGDGVLDANDECPETPPGAAVTPDGCPQTPEIAENIVLQGVAFHSGSSRLTEDSIDILREVAASLAAWPAVHVEVRGHTDAAGSAELNRNLSLRRANAVRAALIELGVSGHRISAVGYGEDYPIATNETTEGRAMNRRVELHRVGQ